MRFIPSILRVAVLAGLFATPAILADDFVRIDDDGRTVQWVPLVDHISQTLTITGPAGFSEERRHDAFHEPTLDTAGLRDGTYKWRLELPQKPAGRVLELIEEGRARDVRNLDDFIVAEGLMTPQVASGTFRVVDGRPVVPRSDEPGDAPRKVDARVVDDLTSVPLKQVISGDLTVYDSLCVGADCLAAETYGDDTIRLKEEALRIHFDDTSTGGTSPQRDWRIVANDVTNGGLDRFTVEDSTAASLPFTIEGGSPSHSLYVDAAGNVGLGTNTPVELIHAVDGDTPVVRLEQNGTSGFLPQSWDIAGNEGNFFIRDVTNSSALPFRIRSGADADSLVVSNNGRVGVFTIIPDSTLHVRRTDGTAKLHVEEATAIQSASARTLLQLTNNGKLDFRMTDSSRNNVWKFENDPLGFFITLDGTGQTELALFENGNMFLAGTLTENSDVDEKQDFEAIDPRRILDDVLELPVTTWSYKDEPGVRHIGPMAQDFYASFGFGGTDKGIQTRNLSSVTLAALQGLHAELETRQERIDELEARLAAVEALLVELTSGPVD